MDVRLLLSCSACQRQFDASDLLPKSRFHCLCGEVLEVPQTASHDAEVVRCSACGAPREGKASSCGFCHADFTLHEQDLQTICPSCMARISDRARFCHYCGVAILPGGVAGEPTDHSCPACDGGKKLLSRLLGEHSISVLECPSCAGLWLSAESFDLLLEKARRIASEAESRSPRLPQSPPRPPGAASQGPLYRPCPVCGTLMHRHNYGRKSGVIVDTCRSHGLWFDTSELEAILRWVKGGGEARARRQRRLEEQEQVRRERLQRGLEPPEPDLASWEGDGALIEALGSVLGTLLHR